MRAASSGTPSGAGLSFFKPSTAFATMPFFGPSLAGRSNNTTGTLQLTRWAAICAPITPAPSTATLRTWNRFMVDGLRFSLWKSVGGEKAQHRRPVRLALVTHPVRVFGAVENQALQPSARRRGGGDAVAVLDRRPA